MKKRVRFIEPRKKSLKPIGSFESRRDRLAVKSISEERKALRVYMKVEKRTQGTNRTDYSKVPLRDKNSRLKGYVRKILTYINQRCKGFKNDPYDVLEDYFEACFAVTSGYYGLNRFVPSDFNKSIFDQWIQKYEDEWELAYFHNRVYTEEDRKVHHNHLAYQPTECSLEEVSFGRNRAE